MVKAGRGDVLKGASPSFGRRQKLQFSVCIFFLVTFTISVEGSWGVIGRAVQLVVYRQPQMVNAGWGDAPKGASLALADATNSSFQFVYFFWLRSQSVWKEVGV